MADTLADYLMAGDIAGYSPGNVQGVADRQEMMDKAGFWKRFQGDIPSMTMLLGARRPAPGFSAWDSLIARNLRRAHPNETAITGGGETGPKGANWYTNSSDGMAGFLSGNDVRLATRPMVDYNFSGMPRTTADMIARRAGTPANSAGRTPISAAEQSYLNSLLAQRSRGSLQIIGGDK